MTSLGSLYASDGNRLELKTNMNVDYVINYKIPVEAKAEAEAGFSQLIAVLTKAGLASEVRPGINNSSVLVFVKVASNRYLKSKIYRERVQDWLYGVRIKAPEKGVDRVFEDEPVSDAERLRMVYLLLTNPKNDGGAGLTPKTGQWKYIDSIFPLHNHEFNRHWIKQWSSKYVLSEEDLDQIRDKFGEKIAFYFAFLQAYFTFLLFPAAFGFGAWLILGQYSWIYAVVNSLWSVIFFEYWKKKEVDLAVQWGVRGVSKIQHPRTEFQWDHEGTDPVTGEPIKIYSPLKRLQTQVLQVPFAVICVLILGALYVFCFSIEIFLSEIYNGPFKSYLTFLPTIILSGLLPTLSSVLGNLAEKLTGAENYETHDGHESALITKIFIVNFITSYLPLFLTAFVYMPFGNLLVPYLDIWKITAEKISSSEKISTQGFEINPDRLKKQIIYFTVTAQVVNLALEVVVPYLKRKIFQKVKEVQSEMAQKNGNDMTSVQDIPEEAAFLARVRKEAGLDVYDVSGDYREMVVQFGYLSLFSAIWPLTPMSFFINNWVELRSDAMKIAVSSQRPIPWRADSIGPWLSALGFLSWFGSLVSFSIVYLFTNDPEGPGGSPSNIKAWGLLLTILGAEHIYLAAQFAVRYVMNQIDSPGLQKERAERFSMRKHMLEETLGQDITEKPELPDVHTGEKITRAALEDEARRESTVGGGTPEIKFWQRQQGAEETASVGRDLISKMASGNKTAKA
ncbi:calcium-activated chloride channel-domain-containing protein [Pseudomassariella vexata]|uniref:Calcium-activated chloride channel-domain-containing protein n=1 Tax=Pseudomassariella vexata TaxID=1141098 RepID=A0A1Y2E1S2_9PEZI|nr:calcium-activated chloride channel-domain-containing protein [Pseudomassariella vexata]ORY65501.1 calcium-activated chloride channel-domain-containing protein [Pseudomassariella vexata]